MYYLALIICSTRLLQGLPKLTGSLCKAATHPGRQPVTTHLSKVTCWLVDVSIRHLVNLELGVSPVHPDWKHQGTNGMKAGCSSFSQRGMMWDSVEGRLANC